jgi:hypothetical protein
VSDNIGDQSVFVRLKVRAGNPVRTPFTLYGPPTVVLAVKVEVVALPFASVTSVSVFVPFANVPLAPEAGAVNVTEAPATGFPYTSTTFATRGSANAESSSVLWGVPLPTEIESGGPEVFDTLKESPAAGKVEAVTLYAPAVVSAVHTEEVAVPVESVTSVSVLVSLAKVHPGSDVAVKSTDTPVAGCPLMVTVATNGSPNAVLTTVLCPPPLVATTTGRGVMCVLLQAVKNANSMPASRAKIIRLGSVKQILIDSLLGNFKSR